MTNNNCRGTTPATRSLEAAEYFEEMQPNIYSGATRLAKSVVSQTVEQPTAVVIPYAGTEGVQDMARVVSVSTDMRANLPA